MAVELVDRPRVLAEPGRAEVLLVERAGRTTACPLPAAAVALTVTPGGTTGCDGAPLPDDWPVGTGRDCRDTSCLVLATFRADDEGRLRRTTWRRLPVAPTAAGVALLADGAPLRSSSSGWLRVGAG